MWLDYFTRHRHIIELRFILFTKNVVILRGDDGEEMCFYTGNMEDEVPDHCVGEELGWIPQENSMTDQTV